MKRTSVIILVLLLVAVGVVYYLLAAGTFAQKNSIERITTTPNVIFEGRDLQVPDGWGVYEFGTRGDVLALTRRSEHGLNPMLTFEDERKKPEDPSKFVSGWQASLRVPGFHPKSLVEYHDNAVDEAGEQCVEMQWDGNQRPLRVICLAGNGRWKLTLSGNDNDLPAFDIVAQQIPAFVRGL